MTREPFARAGPPCVPKLHAHRDCQVLRHAGADQALRISIVVPSYNTASYVQATVHSLLTQSVRELEVIVVDDGSQDDSVARLLACDDSRLTVVRQDNRGLAGARNTGVILSRARFIGFCDSDDVWHPRKAEAHLSLMENAPDIGVTFSSSVYLDDAGVPTGQVLKSRCAEPRVRDLIRRNHLGNGSSAVVRRCCFENVGLYDESLKNVEEWELWVRIAACTPLRIVRLAEPLTGYRIRAGSLSLCYDSFLRNAWAAIQRFGDYVPGFTPRKAQRAYAEVLRVASRKSLAAGEIAQSRDFLLEAARRCPALFVRDSRASALALIELAGMLLPHRAAQLPYRAVERLRARFAASRLEEWQWT